MKSRVRYAPSPTGIPHVGNIRTALFDYFFAKSNGGEFILRLEDTDQARKTEGAIEAIEESLNWLGASWDEYVVQSKRLSEYQKYAKKLVEKGKAVEEEGAIRFITPKDHGPIYWEDAIGDRTISFEANEVDNFIILKKDGYPTYHLANVVDDHLMNITHVIRGDDWISSTPKHILLYEAFGWESPIFAHVPNVMGTDGKKLSKRRGAKSVLEYKKEGFLPEAVLNYLMLLGWAPKDDKTIVSREEVIAEFNLSDVSVSPGIFDEKKLTWMNGEYIRSLSEEDFRQRVFEFDSDLRSYDDALISALMPLAKTRMRTLSDFRLLVLPFVEERVLPKGEIREGFFGVLSQVEDWELENIVSALKNFVMDRQIKFPDLYEAIIGERKGLPLGDVFEILGKERTLLLLKK